MKPRLRPTLAQVLVLAFAIVGGYGYRVSEFQVDFWTALMLCGGF